MGARFATTQWSQVLAARDPTDTESRRALAALCEAYWYPLYAYVGRRRDDVDETYDPTTAEKSRQFEQLGAYLTGDKPQIPYKQAAESLGMSEGAVKAAVHRMRRRFGEVLQEEIAATVTSQDQVEGEIRHLLTGMI